MKSIPPSSYSLVQTHARSFAFGIVTLSVGAIFILGCPADVGERCADSACTRDGINGQDSGLVDGPDVPDVVKPADCDDKADSDNPASTPCVVNDYAVFVDAKDGSDANEGTKEKPVQTIGAALTKRAGKPRVYLCGEGPYREHLKVTSGLLLYGGFTCAGGVWTYSPATKARVAPTDEGTALHIDSVTQEIRVSDVSFESIDAGTKDVSSIAVFVANATNALFRRANMKAGAGALGASGANGDSRSNYTGVKATMGGKASGSTAGGGPSCMCVDGTKSAGGNGAKGDGSGVQSGSAEPIITNANGGGSPDNSSCTAGTVGLHGAAKPGGPASTSHGTLTSNGWDIVTASINAPNGNPAQGGGGGGAKQDSTSAGGGGGCGGCGGAGGVAGGPGGSSFALLALQSTITVEDSNLTSSTGGKGGKGGPGQVGQAGGDPGVGVACNGGGGGNGAGGSGGGGGAGGHSAPVGFVGPEPRVVGGSTLPGSKGPPGDGGDPGLAPGGAGNAGGVGLAGPEGKSQNSLAL